VTTIHDIIPVLLAPDSRTIRSLRFFLWSATKTSCALITISEYSKAALMSCYGIPESQIHVVYNGCDHNVFNAGAPAPGVVNATRHKLGLDRPYLIHYGAMRPNKNLRRLILAYRRLMERNPDFDLDLVLAGAQDLAYEEVAATVWQTAAARGRVVLTGPLDQADLVMVIKGARLAVFPSLCEGFCLPMIESMACGTPTIASSSSCLPEISGGTLQYFDPSSEEEMSNLIEAVLKNDNLRRALAERGRERAARFDWRRCAEETLTVLARVAYRGR
jgi:glycosyltransferase involved in cell wall biosynthesis